ncbi:MAG: ATP-binding protein [Candidatus Omnitrophica bacterium]|nr:ATP-binding protein [Candidatus Omnitrophota bacterium]
MVNNKKPLYALIFFRFVIATIILIVNTALFGLACTPVYFIVSILYFLTIIYLLLLLAGIYHRGLLYAQIILDLIIENLLVHYTGGLDSVISLLLPLSSIAAGIIISPSSAMMTALIGSTLYAGVVSLEYFGVFPMPQGMSPMSPRESSYVFSLLYFRVAVFCIIGFLSAYIADQVRKKDQVVYSLQERLRREDRLSAIGKLAANTAHEIRNPLASISGCVEALKENLVLDAQNEKLFNLIIKETMRLNDIMNGLLEYVKPRKLQLEKVSPDELIDEVIFLLKSSKDFKPGVTIKKESSLGEVKISCDAQQIKQVMFNLLVNAVEAVGKTGVITVRLMAGAADNEIEFDVIDNGEGMPPERMETLFEPFSSGKDNGIGLGLAIVSAIIKEHGGTIKVESKAGKGTVFRVYLLRTIAQK